MDKINAWKAAVTALLGLLTGLWGWMGWLVVGWVALMLLDYITGTCAARKNGTWSSRIAREGVWHKVGMVIVVMVAAGADLLISLVLDHLPLVELPFDFSGLVGPLVLAWYCITELGSITENAVLLGAPVPAWLVRSLAVGKEAIDHAGEAALHAVESENAAAEEKTEGDAPEQDE